MIKRVYLLIPLIVLVSACNQKNEEINIITDDLVSMDQYYGEWTLSLTRNENENMEIDVICEITDGAISFYDNHLAISHTFNYEYITEKKGEFKSYALISLSNHQTNFRVEEQETYVYSIEMRINEDMLELNLISGKFLEDDSSVSQYIGIKSSNVVRKETITYDLVDKTDSIYTRWFAMPTYDELNMTSLYNWPNILENQMYGMDLILGKYLCYEKPSLTEMEDYSGANVYQGIENKYIVVFNDNTAFQLIRGKDELIKVERCSLFPNYWEIINYGNMFECESVQEAYKLSQEISLSNTLSDEEMLFFRENIKGGWLCEVSNGEDINHYYMEMGEFVLKMFNSKEQGTIEYYYWKVEELNIEEGLIKLKVNYLIESKNYEIILKSPYVDIDFELRYNFVDPSLQVLGLENTHIYTRYTEDMEVSLLTIN